ncbi:hypothetical protein B0H14DRAFT_2893447 [Mycena olivaceomarginata]|nr:hypothetical protein B0H14DRAFT_2893447 [Mycena olivaceomarginata]
MKRFFHFHTSRHGKGSHLAQASQGDYTQDGAQHSQAPRAQEIRRAVSYPALSVLPSSFSNGTPNKSSFEAMFDQQTQAAPATVEIPRAPKALPPTPSAPGERMAELTDEEIYRVAVSNAGTSIGKDTGKAEGSLDRLEDGLGAAASNVRTIASTVQAITGNEVVQEIGSAVVKGVPLLMKALEGLSKAHPFAQVAFLPFKFAYEQEQKRRENDRARTSLFESIVDVMRLNVEIRVTIEPTAHGRLAELGEQMKADIRGCYNVLDAMQKQSLIVKFCKAEDWGKQLGQYKATFQRRHDDLHSTLTLNMAMEVHTMPTNIVQKFMKAFQAAKTPQDRIIEAYFRANGDEDAVMKDDAKFANLIKLVNQSTVTHDIQSPSAAGSGTNKSRTGGAGVQATGKTKLDEDERADVARIRKEYRTDITLVIEENMGIFTKRLELGLRRLEEDLRHDIHREADHVISHMEGPYMQLDDKIMRQVWKDQGWRGHAKTRTLVLALRDYLVARAGQANKQIFAVAPASSRAPDSHCQDPETAMGAPLPDSWMVQYLHVKQVRNLQRPRPGYFRFSTIVEVNTFTQSGQPGWSLPRWISYWAIGWQIYATRYCTEIDEIFSEMLLLRDQVGAQMPGNKRYINTYISEIWPIVVGLTSGIERFEAADWLADHFKEYIDAQEAALGSRLEKIQYDIDSLDTVHEILRSEPIERSIFILLAIILRRHLAKMHLCIITELNAEELPDDAGTVKFVVEAAWMRYNDLLALYKHQQIAHMKQNFDWFSCDYFAWKNWTNEQHYKTNEIPSYGSVSQISQMNVKELEGFLIHMARPINIEPDKVKQPVIDANPEATEMQVESQPLPDSIQLANPSSGDQNISTNLSEIQNCLSGVWFGFHITEEEPPSARSDMFYLKIRTTIFSGQTELNIQGEGQSPWWTPDVGTILGTVTTTPNPENKFELNFYLQVPDAWYSYRGTFAPDLQIISGQCDTIGPNGSSSRDTFILKKTPVDRIMCHRPLVSRLNARELWLFAKNAIVDDLRRRKPSVKYLYTRMKMIKRYQELLYRTDGPEDRSELSRLRTSFTVQEVIELRKMFNWYTRAGDFQQALYCDNCGSWITRSRVFCFDCEGGNTVDFDLKEECVSCTMSRSDLLAPHLPTHLLLKTRDMLLLMHQSSIKSRAIYCRDLATRIYAQAAAVPTSPAATDGGASALVDASSVTVTVSATVNTNTADSSQSPPPASDSADPQTTASDGDEGFKSDSAVNTQSDNNATPTPVSTSETVDPQGTVGESQPEIANGPNQSESGDVDDRNANTQQGIITLKCLICREKVSTPCWYCMDCAEVDAFVCTACETKTEELYPWDYVRRYREEVGYVKEAKESLAILKNPSTHTVLHMLIRFGNTVSTQTADAPATDIGQALHEVEHRLLGRMDEDKRQMEKRLAKIEALLEALVLGNAERS